MRLRSLQTGLAERQSGRFLDISGSALPTGRRRRCRRTSSPPLPDGVGFSAESRQHALGDFQLIELIPEPGPFGIEPREPFGNPLLLLSNLVHQSHRLYPSSSLDTKGDVIALVFSIEKYASCSDGYYSEPLSMSAGITDKRAPIFLSGWHEGDARRFLDAMHDRLGDFHCRCFNMKCSILRAAHAKYVGCLDNDGRKRSEGVVT
jgi:hypothetical protein